MKPLKFGTAFKYPFNRAKAMWNILWVFLPIFGWFALGGYGVRIVQEFSKGKFKELPVMEFSDDLELGFMMFLKAIPFMLVYMVFLGLTLLTSQWIGAIIRFAVAFLVIPILAINFINKTTVESWFEFKIVGSVFDNLGDYIMAILKSIGLALVYIPFFIILIGIPAASFTKNIFMADFYRRKVKH